MGHSSAPAGGDLFAPLPLRFKSALVRAEIDADEYLIGCYLAQAAYEVRQTNGGVVLFRLGAFIEEVGWRKSVELLRQKIKALAAKGWIRVEVKQGQRAPWEITLAGLARGGIARPLPNGEGADIWKSNHAGLEVERASDACGQAAPEPRSPAPLGSPRPTDETRLDTACSEGAVDREAAPRPLDDSDLVERLRPKRASSLAPQIEHARQAQARALPRPGAADFVGTVQRLYPRGDTQRIRLFSLHGEAAPAVQGTLNAVLESEIQQLRTAGILERGRA
jgi:hypothetical protein